MDDAYSYQKKKDAVNDTLTDTIVANIAKKYPEDFPEERYIHILREKVRHQLIIQQALNEVNKSEENDEIKTLREALDYKSKSLRLCEDQLIEIANYLNAECGKDLSPEEVIEGDTLAKACIRKIDTLIPNGDRLGDLIDKTQSYVPNLPIIGRSQCHHLGKMLSSAIKKDNETR